ncbi:C2H2 finger domain [Pyrenophora seminiperda CCB06]|uniref:C2H2 finger domain n=1 Tax=Pyrenophora seminiperda CCB06 TaxID=1302712 RepID=A0A3M7M5Z1_9PLEO|nr:C2H2 finger domain [Pyrenophora seminiperda CCB06]
MTEPINVRPASQQRHSSSTMAGSLPKNRPHSHSISAASLNPAHRVTRRKSMSQTPVSNIAALAAAAKGISGAPLEAGSGGSSSGPRRSSKPASQFRGPSMALNSTAMASSMPGNGAQFGPSSYGAAAAKSEALTDGPSLATMLEQDKAGSKSRNRRASEGSRLSKADASKRSGSDLRCEKCGKGYKHSSCLTKHLWEHTPEWQYTSKLLISKHQQVQLLEAASVLVAMNKESDGEHSDRSSPPASGSSDLREELSSTETTPPPQLDDHDHAVGSFPHSHFGTRSAKRYSTNSSAYSQSYQSTVFSDHGHHNGHLRQWSNVSDRPTTSGTSVAGSYHDDANDHADLAAAVGLLSCSYGTPKTGPVALPPDVPPVPPLPAKFLDFNTRSLSGSTTVTAQQSSMRNSYRYHSESKDVDMDDDHFADEEDYRNSNSRSTGRIDEDDDEIFGRMEE